MAWKNILEAVLGQFASCQDTKYNCFSSSTLQLRFRMYYTCSFLFSNLCLSKTRQTNLTWKYCQRPLSHNGGSKPRATNPKQCPYFLWPINCNTAGVWEEDFIQQQKNTFNNGLPGYFKPQSCRLECSQSHYIVYVVFRSDKRLPHRGLFYFSRAYAGQKTLSRQRSKWRS